MRSLKEIIFSVIGITLLSFLYFQIFKTYPANSDSVVVLMVGQDLANGNLLLHNWSLPPDTFYSLDLPFYAIAIRFIGFKPILLSILPSIIFALLVYTSMRIAIEMSDRSAKSIALLFITIFIALPSSFLIIFIATSPMHILTILYIVWVFCLLNKLTENQFLFGLLAYILLVLVNMGDPLSYYIGTLPILMTAVRFSLKKKEDIIAVLICLSAGLTALGLNKLIYVFGGYHTETISPVFATLPQLATNTYHFIELFLRLLNADFFGQQLHELSTFSNLAHFALICLGFTVIFHKFKYKQTGQFKIDERLSYFFAMGLLFNFVAFVFSNLYIDEAQARYLIPATVYFTILIAIEHPKWANNKKQWLVGLALLLFIDGYGFCKSYPQLTTQDDGSAEVISYLTSQHLTQGYAGYWESHVLTVKARESIKVYPVDVSNQGFIAPFNFLSKSTWYLPSPENAAHFFIYRDNSKSGVSRASVVQSFGQPYQETDISGWHILIWKNDITPLLK